MSTTRKNTLTVRSEVQKALFCLELQGQISDGRWENARPYGHYKKWCGCEVVVGEGIGRDFWAEKDNYNFCDSQLLSVVGERMLRNARRALVYGFERAEELSHVADMEGKLDRPTYEGEYWDRKRAAFDAIVDLAEVQQVSEDKSLYNKKDMLADLKDLKKIVRTNVPVLAGAVG